MLIIVIGSGSDLLLINQQALPEPITFFIYVREHNDPNVQVIITQLIWITWTPMSAVPKRPLNLIAPSLILQHCGIVSDHQTC